MDQYYQGETSALEDDKALGDVLRTLQPGRFSKIIFLDFQEQTSNPGLE